MYLVFLEYLVDLENHQCPEYLENHQCPEYLVDLECPENHQFLEHL
jgi:hypothetical protein